MIIAAHAGDTHCPQSLTPYEATYTSTYKNITMTGKRQLSRDNSGKYTLTHRASRMGSSIRESSIFSVANNNIRTEQYDMSRSMLAIKREYHNRYDWQQGTVTVSGHANVTLPLENEPLDLLNYQLALRCDLEQQRQALTYPVVARNRLKNYAFKQHGEEILETPMGQLDTLVVDRLRKDADRTTRVWIAPSLNYLIVKLEQFEQSDNANYQLQLKQVSFE